MKKVFAVVAVLCFAAPVFAGWSVSSTQTDSDTLDVEVTPSQGETWNDLKIPCNSGDTAGSFSTPTTDWAVDRVEQVGQRNYVVLHYNNLSTALGSAQTITVDGPNNRTGCGQFIVTLNGANVYSTSRDGNGNRLPSFCMAGINFSCDVNDSGVVTVYFVDNSCEQLRAVGLDITVDNDANITDVNDDNSAYWVYPGSIDINEKGDIIGLGNCVADVCEFPDGTLPGLNSYGVTIEKGSLYVGDANAPVDNGVMLTLTVDKNCIITIAANEKRSGVVLEVPSAEPGDNLPIECEFSAGGCPSCAGDGPPYDGTVTFQELVDALTDMGNNNYDNILENDPNYDPCFDWDGIPPWTFQDLVDFLTAMGNNDYDNHDCDDPWPE
jgi:hypothetical protein